MAHTAILSSITSLFSPILLDSAFGASTTLVLSHTAIIIKEKRHPRNPKSNAYSSSSSNHFITFSHLQLFTFSIECKYYVCVISHCHKALSSTRQPESITHCLLSSSSRIIYALVVATYIANTVLELLQRSENEDHRRWTPSFTSFILTHAFRYMPHAAVGLELIRKLSICFSPLN